MTKNLIYNFENISFLVNTACETLISYLDDYTFLERVKTPLKTVYTYNFYEKDSLNAITDKIPKSAEIVQDIVGEVDGQRRYTRYRFGKNHRWLVIENFGAVHTDIKNKTFTAIVFNRLESGDILRFLLLCSNIITGATRRSGYYSLHSACINVNGKHTLITGQSGSGKSTATFALINRGHSALTDESTLIKKANDGYSANSIMNWVKVEEGAKKNFFDKHNASYIRCESAYIFKLSDVNNESICKANRIDHILILEQTGREKTTIKTAGPLEVVRELFPVTLPAKNKTYAEDAFIVLMDFLGTVECSKVLFGTDMDDFAKAVEQRLAD